jgi:hypothetical protein
MGQQKIALKEIWKNDDELYDEDEVAEAKTAFKVPRLR